MDLDNVRSEIEHMRIQVVRQRKEILQLHRAGIGRASAELLLQIMLAKIDDLCAERERLKSKQGGPTRGACLVAGVGEGQSIELVRQGKQLTLDRRAG